MAPCLVYVYELRVFSSVASPLDLMPLWSNLEILVPWCSINKLALNISKYYSQILSTLYFSILLVDIVCHI